LLISAILARALTEPIERCWSRLKEWRAIAARYDKTATSYAAGIAIAATLDWFKSSP
jgi:transposase